MKRILVNATQQEELRVAIVDGQKLYNLDIEAATKRQKKGNIYKGVISSIAPSLNAVFVDYGSARHGFLPTREICPKYFTADFQGPIRKQVIHKLIEEGQEIIVQIVREELSTKGASLSTYVSLTGLYMVLLPDKPRTHGISQRISGTERRRMIDISRQIVTEKNEGIILRTACLNAEKEDLQKNLDYLRYLWKQIQKTCDERPAPFLIYKEANIVLQTIQDNLGSDISEIIIDNQEIYEETKEFLSMVLPSYKKKLKLYSGNIPLFNRMHLETQIESLYQHKINLPSGGAIVLDHTEALTTIDINSARSTSQHDLEETALNTNLEAADEIARQLRLRDLGGLLVIDFIDMMPRQNKHKVEEHMRELLKKDRARTRLGSISNFGILEMSRQRLRTSLKDESEILCPRCIGRGFIRTVKSCALVVLRLIEEEAGKPKTEKVIGQLPAEVNKFLINEKRNELNEIEKRYEVKVSIISDPQMETPHYKIMRHREDNVAGYGKDHGQPASVRSSLSEQQLFEKQNEAEKNLEETPALPPVLVINKTTLSETFKNLWKKCMALFTFKKASDKQSHKTYGKQKRKYTSRKPRSSYANRSRYKKTRTSSSDKGQFNHKKSAPTDMNSRSEEHTSKQQDFKKKSEFSPLKNFPYSKRRNRQYQQSKTDHKNNQHRTSSSRQRDNAMNRPTEEAYSKTPSPASSSRQRNDAMSRPTEEAYSKTPSPALSSRQRNDAMSRPTKEAYSKTPSPASSSYPHDNTVSRPTEEAYSKTPSRSDKNNHPTSTPQTVKTAFRPDAIFKQPQTGDGKPKLIQIETKTSTDNDSK